MKTIMRLTPGLTDGTLDQESPVDREGIEISALEVPQSWK